MAAPSPVSRLTFVDWTRGLAATVMLQGHVFHAFTRPDLRTEGPYVLSQFVGGMPPAIFLFLTGVTLAFMMHRSDRQGLSGGRKIITALGRATFLFGIAMALRIQLWLFSWPHSHWSDLLKVDILNCMGFGIAVLAVMSVFPALDRARLCAVLGVSIAAAAPLISQLDWSQAPLLLRNYLAPDYNYFSFFPWAAFLAFGLSAGSILRATAPENMSRLMQWACLGGFGLVLGGQYFSNLPYSVYPKSEFWLDSPALVFIKLGLILVILAFAYLWTQFGAGETWSWVRQLGTTSLLVYWVHIELVYGRWFQGWKESLNAGQVAAAACALTLLMIAVSVIRTNWNNWRNWLRAAGLGYSPEASGE
jgi:uncharacterized membrane protein